MLLLAAEHDRVAFEVPITDNDVALVTQQNIATFPGPKTMTSNSVVLGTSKEVARFLRTLGADQETFPLVQKHGDVHKTMGPLARVGTLATHQEWRSQRASHLNELRTGAVNINGDTVVLPLPDDRLPTARYVVQDIALCGVSSDPQQPFEDLLILKMQDDGGDVPRGLFKSEAVHDVMTFTVHRGAKKRMKIEAPVFMCDNKGFPVNLSVS